MMGLMKILWVMPGQMMEETPGKTKMKVEMPGKVMRMMEMVGEE